MLPFKMFRDQIAKREWLALKHDQFFTSHWTRFIITTSCSYIVGFNIPIKWLTVIKNNI
jgi:hypothetical protein